MIKNALTSLKPSVQNIVGNKGNLFLALIPILIGILVFALLGSWAYGPLMDEGRVMIDNYLSEGALGSVVYYLIVAVLSVLLFFVVNWTFVLVVTVLASPFNDMLSKRVEKLLKGEELESFAASFAEITKTFLKTLFEEIKKISLILLLSLVAFVIGYIPILTPLSLAITVILLAISFIDYSWSRHSISFSACIKDTKRNLLSYGLGGAFFFALVSIPIVNLLVSSWATSYFTVLWVKNNEHSN